MESRAIYFRELIPEFREMRRLGYSKQNTKYEVELARDLIKEGMMPKYVRDEISPKRTPDNVSHANSADKILIGLTSAGLIAAPELPLYAKVIWLVLWLLLQ